MYKTEKVSDFVKFLEANNVRGFKRHVYIVNYWLTKFITWFYLTFIVRIISLPLNLYYVFSALLAGELKNVIALIRYVKKTLKLNPEQFWDYYYTYASYSYYTPDELIEIYGKSTKTFVKDWNSWFITSVIRKFKGDCDDYTVITSKLLSFAGEKSRKYVTFATTVKDGKLVFSKDAHSVILTPDNAKLSELQNKILTWGKAFSINEYNKLYLKTYPVRGTRSKDNYLIYVRYL